MRKVVYTVTLTLMAAWLVMALLWHVGNIIFILLLLAFISLTFNYTWDNKRRDSNESYEHHK